MSKVALRGFAMACALLAAGSWAMAADGIESRPVHFAKGASSATLKGALKGDKTIDYRLGAKAGQTMSVTLKTSNAANYFNVLPPGSAQCDFGVIRGKPGNAEVHVTPPGGFKRVLTFAAGKVSVESGASVKATRSGDLWSVDVNDYEHYRIPEAVISGG